jgi:MFS transporter, DHA2 family, multidrug resistance protein
MRVEDVCSSIRTLWGNGVDTEQHASTPSHLGVRERWLTTALLGLGLVTFAIDASNTTLILPQIMTSLRVELYEIHWVLTAPGIMRTVTIAATGWLSGLFGPRTLYLISIGSMTVGSLGSMLAWDWPSLVFFRILAGIGGGMIPQISQAIFYQIFPPGQRGMALGFALLGWSIGPAFGPLMGGNLLEAASWRVVYAISLPLCGLGFILSWWLLPPLRRPERRRLDPYGLLTLAVAVSTLLLALTQGNREGWDSQYILTLLVIAGAAGVAFVVLELCHPEPLVELRLFGSVPFVMAMIVLFLTVMTFRGSGPMISVLQQRLLGFEPLLVAWSQMLPNLVYGGMVLLVGRLSDRVPCHVLVLSGLLVYAAGFWGYAGVNEMTSVAMFMPFLMIRFVSEAFIGSPNNLATLQALPENKVYMATALSGLLRSIANTTGTAVAAVVWDQRYTYHLQHYAENTPLDTFGFTAALSGFQQTLRWSGEIAAQIPSQSMTLMQDRLLAEASTAAWQDYFLFNAFLAILCLFPALPCWRREKYVDPAIPQAAAAPVQHAATSNAAALSETSGREHATLTPPAGLRTEGKQ